MKILFLTLLLFFFFLPVIMENVRRHSERKIRSRQLLNKSDDFFSFWSPSLRWLAISCRFFLRLLPERFLTALSSDEEGWQLAAALDPGLKKWTYTRHCLISRLMILYGTLLTSILLMLLSEILLPVRTPDSGQLTREAANGNAYSQDLTADINGQREDISISVSPRIYDTRERRQLLDKVKHYIDETLPGENLSLSDVKYPLHFPESVPDENVSIDWECDDYNLISQDGSLGDLSEVSLPTVTSVTALIRYAGYERSYTKEITITEYLREEAALSDKLMEEIRKNDEKSRERDYLPLPSTLDGQEIIWLYTRPVSPALLFPGLSLAAAAAISRKKQRMKEETKLRQQQLALEYPVFVHRMVLMLGAGMTPRRSWNMLTEDLIKTEEENQKRSKRYKRKNGISYLQREMKYTSLQMKAGIPETDAYMEFGRRTGQPGYEQFAQLIVQMIRKGRSGIQEMMMEQAEQAQKQRRDLAQTMGETAGTRLLLPMGILLIVVIFLVMAPAFMGF